MRILKGLDEDDKTAFAIAKGLAEDDGGRHFRHPEGSRGVPLTMSVSSDGSGAPCTDEDTKESKGKDGGDADTREVKLLAVTFYNRVDKKGRPIVNRDCILRFASTERSDKFISEVNAILSKMDCGGVERVQFVSDGAAWLETLFRQVFEGFREARKTVVRTLDFYHAAEYLATVVRALAAETEFKATFADLKRLMKKQDGEKAIAAHRREVREGAHGRPWRRGGEGSELHQAASRLHALRRVQTRRLLHRLGHGRVDVQVRRRSQMQARGNALAPRHRRGDYDHSRNPPLKPPYCRMTTSQKLFTPLVRE